MDPGGQDQLTLDPGDQDLLGFLLEESGDLWPANEQDVEAPLDLELSPSEVGGGSEWGRKATSVRPKGTEIKSRPVNLLELRARTERLGGRGFTELSAQSLGIAGCSQLLQLFYSP